MFVACQGHLITVNVGDSRAMLARRGPDGRMHGIELTHDAKPNDPLVCSFLHVTLSHSDTKAGIPLPHPRLQCRAKAAAQQLAGWPLALNERSACMHCRDCQSRDSGWMACLARGVLGA